MHSPKTGAWVVRAGPAKLFGTDGDAHDNSEFCMLTGIRAGEHGTFCCPFVLGNG
jgi:hypothetical protein